MTANEHTQITAGLGHNKGPTMEHGQSWRKHCWTKARRDLLPKMPLEIVRIRVRRAQELGLDYKTYATVRATTGGDIVAFLFSTNALRLHRAKDALADAHATKLTDLVGADRLLAVQPPLTPTDVAGKLEALGIRVAASMAAPTLTASWSDLRTSLSDMAAQAKVKSGSVLVVGSTTLEREWVAAGRMAGFVSADRYFGPTA